MNKNFIKIVLLGDGIFLILGRVGKTSILNRYINNTFNDSQEMTVNVSYFQKDLDFDGVKYTFCLWDTAGQEKFNALNNIYYRDAQGAILVYDVSIKETFSKVEKWHDEIKIFNKDAVISIAGNKIDLGIIDVDKQKIIEQVFKFSYSKENNCEHFYTSARTGEGLEEIFYKVAKDIAKQISQQPSTNSKKRGIKLSNENKEKIKEGCC